VQRVPPVGFGVREALLRDPRDVVDVWRRSAIRRNSPPRHAV